MDMDEQLEAYHKDNGSLKMELETLSEALVLKHANIRRQQEMYRRAVSALAALAKELDQVCIYLGRVVQILII